MKILYITTIGATMGFFQELVKDLLDKGNTLDIACNFKKSPVPECYREWGCRIYYLPCERSPFVGGNLVAVRKLKQLVEKRKYDIVHCHTPVASACTRIACIGVRQKGMKVFYTAHGFHFYNGAPLKNWLLYYPMEWLCSWWTDVLVTINLEDYKRAKRGFHAKKVVCVPGVGVDTEKFHRNPDSRVKKRKELGLEDSDIMLLSVGELNENKNHFVVIKALAEIKNKKVHYFVAGQGELKMKLLELIDSLKIAAQVHLLGYRTDVPELMAAADIFLLPSIREGLNVSLMEAMASGLPCICSDIRGNCDLIENNIDGYRVDALDVNGWKKAIEKVMTGKEDMGRNNATKIKKYFSTETVMEKMKDIYLNDGNVVRMQNSNCWADKTKSV